MPPSSTSTTLSSCFPEKLEMCFGHRVHDSPVNSSPSFDSVAEVDCESESDPESRDTDQDNDGDEDSDVSHTDIPARTLSVDRFFASSVHAFNEGGSSLSAMTEEDEDDDKDEDEDEEDEDEEDEEDEEDAGFAMTTSESSNARSLVDRIFADGCAPSRYKVASVPSLTVIEENDEADPKEDDYAQTLPSVDVESEHFDGAASNHRPDSTRLSPPSFSTLDGDDQIPGGDPDSGWVWVEREDSEITEPPTVPLARSCEAREWRWRRAIRKFFAL